MNLIISARLIYYYYHHHYCYYYYYHYYFNLILNELNAKDIGQLCHGNNFFLGGVILKRVTTPTHPHSSHSPPPTPTWPKYTFTHPLSLPPIHKKCPPTPTHSKYTSTHPHPPKIYLHPIPPSHKMYPCNGSHPKYTILINVLS